MSTVRIARLLVFAVTISLAACRDDAPEAAPVAEETPDVRAAADSAAREEAMINAIPLEDVTDSIVTVTFTDGGITLQPRMVRRGAVTVMIENQDDEAHALELVSRTGSQWRSLPAPPGSSGFSLSMVLSPGLHDVYSVTGRESGMEAVLTVR